jgi:hypothetical protein
MMIDRRLETSTDLKALEGAFATRAELGAAVNEPFGRSSSDFIAMDVVGHVEGTMADEVRKNDVCGAFGVFVEDDLRVK